MALVMPKKRWHILLILGIVFHLSIAITMGLISFGITMIAALILYLRPFENEFSFAFVQSFFKRFKKSSEQKTLAESA
jgi:uncharacterized membrane protein